MPFSVIGVKSGLPKSVSFSSLAQSIHEFDYVWVDARGLDSKEGAALSKVFNFHFLSIEDALSDDSIARLADFNEYIFLTVFDVFLQDEKFLPKKLSVFFGKNFVVTISKNGFAAVERTVASYQKDASLYIKGHAFILYNILDVLIDNYFPALDGIAESIDILETEVFSHVKRQTLSNLFRLKRRVISFRRIINPQREVLFRLSRHESFFVPHEYLVYFGDLHNRLLRVSEAIDTYRELISDTMEAYLTVISNRLNEIMKVLTIIATIVLPLTLVTGFYGMNVDFFEYAVFGKAGTYFFAVFLMCIIFFLMLFWFRRNKWL